jgi:hypothetical protein
MLTIVLVKASDLCKIMSHKSSSMDILNQVVEFDVWLLYTIDTLKILHECSLGIDIVKG